MGYDNLPDERPGEIKDAASATANAPAALAVGEPERQWLDNDPLLSRAEVRDTGGGLHVLLWLDEPILCDGEEARC